MSDPGRVFVYRCTEPGEPRFTVRDLVTGTVTESDDVWLSDAVFEVSPAGWLVAVAEHRRTVHAGVFGTLVSPPRRELRCDLAVRYRPAESPWFFDDENRPIHEASLVHLIKGGAYVRREDRWL